MRSTILVTVVLALGLALGACGDDNSSKTCESICAEAQSRQCTTITDCTLGCSAARAVTPKGGCQSQHDAYLSCSQSTADVCTISTNCNSQETAYETCLGLYCYSNQTDQDCIDLDNSI